jgi:tRNA threonylcarbamoyladenosine biosynthesis protein TsaB
MDARMGEVYAARYLHLDGSWRTVDAPGLHTPEALVDIWRREPPQVVAGNAVAAFAGRIDCGSAIVIGDALPRARALLACARANWLRGEAKDAAAALPTYLRNRVAMTTAQRDALRAASLIG